MLYLMIFSALALGFYAQTIVSAQVAGNERTALEAQVAAECGLQFIRYHLAAVEVPAGTTDDVTFEELYMQLAGRLELTPNLGTRLVGYSPRSPLDPGSKSVISIPDGDAEFIQLDPGGQRFRVVITQSAKDLQVRITGRTAGTVPQRAITLTFAPEQLRGTVLDYSIASRSPIEIEETILTTPLRAGGVKAGSLLVTSARTTPTLELDDDTVIAGDIYFTSPTPTLEFDDKVTVAGLAPSDPNFNSHIHKGFPLPKFPVIDTDVFKPYAGNPAYGGTVISSSTSFTNTTLKNVLIKANTNPTFGNGTVLQGVIYVETPNNITFDRATEIRGVIAVQNNPTGTAATNQMVFKDTPLYSIESLPAIDPAFPPELRALTGSMILAPKFFLDFDDADFPASTVTGTIGNIVADRISLDEYALGAIKGSLIVLADTEDGMEIEADAQMSFQVPDPDKLPAGMYFSHRYMAVSQTYSEGIQ